MLISSLCFASMSAMAKDLSEKFSSVQLVFFRSAVVEKLGEYKRDNNVAVLQLDRWKQLHSDRANQAKGLALYPEFVEELFKLIHSESIRKQTEVMNSATA